MDILKNKVAVITGGTRGLGLSIAQTYGAAGAAVVVTGRSQSTIDKVVADLQADGVQAAGIACDVSDFKQVEALGDFAVKTFGKIDIWVNNAGVSAPFGPTASIPHDSVVQVVNTNILGVYNGSMVALHYLLPQRSGKLINMLGREGPVKYQNAYSSSKAWVRSFTLALAQEYQDSGVEILAFNPGLVDTDMLRHVEAVQGYEKRLKPLETVIRLWGNEPEVPAQKALWLASLATDGRTGLSVNVLSFQNLISGILREGFRFLTGQPKPDTTVDVHTISPEF